jgi:nucleotide sugar dehydrogenase
LNICVYGLWHLGSVTAACLAEIGHNAIGLDSIDETVKNLNLGKAPIFEPGLDELIQKNYSQGCLYFTTNPKEALDNASVLWICHDTPVNDKNEANPDFVIQKIKDILPKLKPETLVIISSQLPVGSLEEIEFYYATALKSPDKDNYPSDLHFVVIPENLRLGHSIKNFLYPDRMVVGVRDGSLDDIARHKLIALNLQKSLCPIHFMSPESAEMVKHATNAWLATSITFANEIAAICEKTGADYRDVEIALKNDSRIGEKAYIKAGLPYSGGTLARDIGYLEETLYSPFFHGVDQSNEYHKNWVTDTLIEALAPPNKPVVEKVVILGLTYKTGTDTQRCSLSKDLIEDLEAGGFVVNTHDPSVNKNSAQSTVDDSQAVIVMTPHPEYQKLTFKNQIVIDPNGFLRNKLENQKDIEYYCVGKRHE